jgi:hypothetical protein
MAACRSLLYLSVAYFFVAFVSAWLLKLIILNFVYLIGLTALAKQESKSQAEGKSGTTFYFALVFYCATLTSIMFAFGLPFFPALSFILFVVYLSTGAARRFATDHNFKALQKVGPASGNSILGSPPTMGQTIARFLAGICLLDGLIVYSVSGSSGLFICFLFLFFATLVSQRLVQGT